MTSILVTPDTATASVLLEITTSSTVSRILRNDANGINEVRVLAGQLPSLSVVAEQRRNYIVNPSLETNITGYAATQAPNSALSRMTTGGRFGSALLRLTTSAVFLPSALVSTTYTATLTGGKTYVSSVYIKTSMANSDVGYSMYMTQVSTGFAITRTPIVGPIVDGWYRCAATFTVPGTGPQTISFRTGAGNLNGEMPVGTTIDFDGFLLEEGTALRAYFDGDTVDTADSNYGWTGTAHASESNAVGPRTLVVNDYEASAGLNVYTIEDDSGVPSSATADLVLDKPWLLVPIMPHFSSQVETITNYGSSRDSHSTMHKVIGRADPLISFGPLGTRTGSLELFCNSLAEARRLEAIFTRGESVMLKQNVTGMDMYFVCSATGISPYSIEGQEFTRYALSVNYTEVSRPIGALSGALGWTLSALASEYASYNEVSVKFATFDALTIKDEI